MRKIGDIVVIAGVIFLTVLSLEAHARVIGHVDALLDVNYSIDDSFDGVCGKDYMLGGGLRLNFDILKGFSAGVEYARYSQDGQLFNMFDTSYGLHTLEFNVGWRYPVASLF